MGKRACEQGKNGSKLGLDLNEKFRAWQTASDLSKQIGERPDVIRKNANTGVDCNGYLIGGREPVPEDNAHPATQMVYRVEYADEQAVRRAKELEAEVDELRGKALELARAYDEIDHRGADQEETLIEYIRRVSSSVQIHKDMIAAQERSQAELREDVERLEAELHHANGLLTRRKTEIDELKSGIADAEKWKNRAHRESSARHLAEWGADDLRERLDAAGDERLRAYKAGRADASARDVARNMVRSAISRVLGVGLEEVVR